VQRVRERGGHIQPGRAQLAATGDSDVRPPSYLGDLLAQGHEVVAWHAENGNTEERVLLPTVAGGSFQVGVAEAVATAPYDEKLVIGRRSSPKNARRWKAERGH
jgi:hypothetical protein